MEQLQTNEETVVTVLQGQYHVTTQARDKLATVLGSCVACCMFDTGAGIGGMNHFLLADDGASSGFDVKYGSHSMEMLINTLLKGGAERNRLQAKLFGGANITRGLGDIGDRNARFALKFLEDEGIDCVNHSLGGSNARRLHFWPTTGNARQYIVPKADVQSEIPPRPIQKIEDDIELF